MHLHSNSTIQSSFEQAGEGVSSAALLVAKSLVVVVIVNLILLRSG